MSNYPDDFTYTPYEKAESARLQSIHELLHTEQSWADYVDGAMDQLAEAIAPWLTEYAGNNERSWESTILDKAFVLLEAKLNPG